MKCYLLSAATCFLLALTTFGAGCDSLDDETDLFLMTATIDGEEWEGSAYGFLQNDTLLIVGERRTNEIQQIVVLLPDYEGPEIYTIAEEEGLYLTAGQDTSVYYSTEAETNELILESIDLDALIADGTFSFSVQADSTTPPIGITNGRFKTRIQARGL